MERLPGVIAISDTTMVTPTDAANALWEAFQSGEALRYDTRNVTREPGDVAVSRQRGRDELSPAVRHRHIRISHGSVPDAAALVNRRRKRRRPTAGGHLKLPAVTAVVTGTHAD